MSNRAPEAVSAQLSEAKGTSLARELFTSNFWMSGLAMLKYIPRCLRLKQVDGMAFFADAKQRRVYEPNPEDHSWELEKMRF